MACQCYNTRAKDNTDGNIGKKKKKTFLHCPNYLLKYIDRSSLLSFTLAGTYHDKADPHATPQDQQHQQQDPVSD